MKNPFTDPDHLDNGDFECVRNPHFYLNNVLSFPQTIVRWWDTFYRTYFGFGVAHDGSTWCKCDPCMNISMHRLTGSRRPTSPGYENRARLTQRSYILKHRKALLELLRPIFATIPDAARYTFREVLDHHADPHPKKALRVQAFEELVSSGTWTDYSGWMNSIPELKMKTEEVAKPGKKGRTIVDLGPRASLAGAFLTDALKQAMNDHPIILPGGELHFVKSPTPDDLRTVFDQLTATRTNKFFVYHSDDSCYAGPEGYGNADISNCDGSHTYALFELLYNSVPQEVQPAIAELINQCRADLRVVSCADKNNFFVLRPRVPKLYSGSTLTTLLNNLANVLIGHSYIVYGGDIATAAARVGYDVTDQRCHIPEDLQFLKHSPIADVDGVHQPLLNLGVLMRLSGVCKRDLPGRGPLRPRAEAFQAALLHGVMAHSSFPLLDRMRKLVAHATPTARMAAYAASHFGHLPAASAPTFFTDEAVMRRYHLTAQEVAEVQLLGDVGYGETIGNPSISRVLQKDYGLTCRNVV